MKHTHEEIMKMSAEELRKAIAEAKGWKEQWSIEIITHEMAKDAGDMRLEGREIQWGGWEEGTNPPDWPADIAAAWELVEEMKREDYPSPQIFCRDEDQLWHAAYRYAGDQGYAEFTGEIAPLAISRVWYAWFEALHD